MHNLGEFSDVNVPIERSQPEGLCVCVFVYACVCLQITGS